MRIGDDNHFMISCRESSCPPFSTPTILTCGVVMLGVESPLIGDHNTFQPRSNASSGVIITHHCTLCPSFSFSSPSRL